LAFGTTLPWLSVTTPVIVPVDTCEKHMQERSKITKQQNSTFVWTAERLILAFSVTDASRMSTPSCGCRFCSSSREKTS
jgi:hypothetical protein